MDLYPPTILFPNRSNVPAPDSISSRKDPDAHRLPLRKILVMISVLCISLIGVFLYFLTPPENFPRNHIVTIPDGANARSVARLFEHESLVRSSFMFLLALQYQGQDTGIIAGKYIFDVPLGAIPLSKRISEGSFGIQEIRLTIPEGKSHRELAEIVQRNFPSISAQKFLDSAEGTEGYLFPDTYTFFATATATEIVTKMRSHYETKLAPLRLEILNSKHTEQEIITMASLIEGEARTTESRKLVAGILWNRIEHRMPLQVDAVFPYILGTSTPKVSLDHLQIESPYNTYRNKGLPPTPINNPGIDAIESALHPTQTDFLFYLTDSEGVMHYAKDFEEHKVNKRTYLR